MCTDRLPILGEAVGNTVTVPVLRCCECVSKEGESSCCLCCGLCPLSFLISIILIACDLGADWRVWCTFQKDGTSDDPLLPPDPLWMQFWLGFCCVGTFLGVCYFISGCAGYMYMCIMTDLGDRHPREIPVCNNKTREEIFHFFYLIFEDIPLMVLVYFYWRVQSSCRYTDQDESADVLFSVAIGTCFALWRTIRFILWTCCRCGRCSYSNHEDIICPLKVDDDYAKQCIRRLSWCGLCFSKFIEVGLVFAGITAVVLIRNLNKTESIPDQLRLQVMRSEPFGSLLNVLDVAQKGNHSIIETFPATPEHETPGPITCIATFKYVSNGSNEEIVYNVAYINNHTTINETSVCIPNHEQCNPLYKDLFYSFSTSDIEDDSSDVIDDSSEAIAKAKDQVSNFRPYPCVSSNTTILWKELIQQSDSPRLDKTLPTCAWM